MIHLTIVGSFQEGVLVGSDHNAEWLLPWWWGHYSAHNDYPVAFADFGMSRTGRRWCEKRGHCFTPTTPPLKKLPSKTRSHWEETFGAGIWHFRAAWFKKPTACLQSPFARTCWLDLDCEVRGSLEPIFHSLTFAEIALVGDPTHRVDPQTPLDEVAYNSGVVAFCKESEILRHWVALASRENEIFVSDQEALSRAIYIHRPKLLELPPIYNWFRPLGSNPDALIIHYLCGCKAELARKLWPSEHL